MAVRYAVATGNWSNPLIWDGGVSLPTIGDDVYANGYTVTVDQDIEVVKISTEVCPTTLIEGGRFTIAPSAIRVIIADVKAGSTYCLYSEIYNLRLTVVGDICGGYGSVSYGFFTNSLLYLTLTGNLIGGVGTYAHAYYRIGGNSGYHCYMTVIGNMVCSTTGMAANHLTGLLYLTLTGNIYSDATAFVGGYQIEIYGNVYCQANCALIGDVFGDVSGSSSLIIHGNIYHSSTVFAFTNFNFFELVGGSILQLKDSLGNDNILYTADAFDQPGEENVREGTSYASGTLEGTLAVPPAESVVKNVRVDNTVGTWALSGDLITRLEKCATTEEVDSAIASYNT